MGPETAKKRLEELGVPFTEESFASYVRRGDCGIVELFLDSEMRASAKNQEGIPVLVVACRQGHMEIARKLIDRGATVDDLFQEIANQAKSKKDKWDKLSGLSSIATVLSSVLIASVGWYFTQTYSKRQAQVAADQNRQDAALKEQQNRVLELETMEKMIPHLTKDEESKRVALISIRNLANPKLAAEMAQLYPSQASVDVLRQMARTGDEREISEAVGALSSIASGGSPASASAQTALADVLHKVLDSVVEIDGDRYYGHPQPLGIFVTSSGYILTPLSYRSGYQTVHLANGTMLNGVPAAPPEYGLNILKVEGSHYPPLALAPSVPTTGSLVIAPGDPAGGKKSARVGTVESSTDLDVNIRFSKDDPPPETGGAPIVNESGEVVGILRFHDNTNMGIPWIRTAVRSDVALRYLKQQRIQLKR